MAGTFGRNLADGNPQRLRFANNLGRHFHIGLGSRYRGDAQQFLVAGNQVAFFVQIPNDQLSRLCTAGRTEIAPNCHSRWSLRFPGFDRKFSNEGFSISSISPELR